MSSSVFTPSGAEAQIDEPLRESIARLPPVQRIVYTLFYFENLTLEQIGEIFQRPEDEIAVLFYWAHANIGFVPHQPCVPA